MKVISYQIIALLMMVMVQTSVRAETIQSLAKVEQVAYEFSLEQAQTRYDRPQLSLQSLDTRLRLQACEGTLRAFVNNENWGAENQTIGVKCERPVAWTVYVPVKIAVYQPILVTTKNLPAKHVLTRSDVQKQARNIMALRRGYLDQKDHVLGKQIKRSLKLGAVIKPSNLASQKIVSRGEHIVLVATSGRMEVRMKGQALSDARKGQHVKVKNLSSKRIVEGIVTGPGIVSVAM